MTTDHYVSFSASGVKVDLDRFLSTDQGKETIAAASRAPAIRVSDARKPPQIFGAHPMIPTTAIHLAISCLDQAILRGYRASDPDNQRIAELVAAKAAMQKFSAALAAQGTGAVPVAWRRISSDGAQHFFTRDAKGVAKDHKMGRLAWEPLYTAPPVEVTAQAEVAWIDEIGRDGKPTGYMLRGKAAERQAGGG